MKTIIFDSIKEVKTYGLYSQTKRAGEVFEVIRTDDIKQTIELYHTLVGKEIPEVIPILK